MELKGGNMKRKTTGILISCVVSICCMVVLSMSSHTHDVYASYSRYVTANNVVVRKKHQIRKDRWIIQESSKGSLLQEEKILYEDQIWKILSIYRNKISVKEETSCCNSTESSEYNNRYIYKICNGKSFDDP